MSVFASRVRNLMGASCFAVSASKLLPLVKFSNPALVSAEPRSQIQKKHPKGCFRLYGGGPGITRNRLVTVSARWASPLCGSVSKAPGVALGRTRRTSKPNPKRIHKKNRPEGRFFHRWRWARDSNPGNLSVQRFSRPPLSTTQPAHLNLSRLPSREAPHYSDASLTIKLPVRYFPRNLYPLQLPLLEGLAGRLLPAQGCSRFSQRLGTLPS